MSVLLHYLVTHDLFTIFRLQYYEKTSLNRDGQQNIQSSVTSNHWT